MKKYEKVNRDKGEKIHLLSGILNHNKDSILSDIDSLDYEDKHYQRRKTDLENRLYKTYDKMNEAENLSCRL